MNEADYGYLAYIKVEELQKRIKSLEGGIKTFSEKAYKTYNGISSFNYEIKRSMLVKCQKQHTTVYVSASAEGISGTFKILLNGNEVFSSSFNGDAEKELHVDLRQGENVIKVVIVSTVNFTADLYIEVAGQVERIERDYRLKYLGMKNIGVKDGEDYFIYQIEDDDTKTLKYALYSVKDVDFSYNFSTFQGVARYNDNQCKMISVNSSGVETFNVLMPSVYRSVSVGYYNNARVYFVVKGNTLYYVTVRMGVVEEHSTDIKCLAVKYFSADSGDFLILELQNGRCVLSLTGSLFEIGNKYSLCKNGSYRVICDENLKLWGNENGKLYERTLSQGVLVRGSVIGDYEEGIITSVGVKVFFTDGNITVIRG